ncbi:MAG: MFS transporter [Sphingomonadales bacterium]|nr:MAG: MFS transporter [Sphingomonadales bacterium]
MSARQTFSADTPRSTGFLLLFALANAGAVIGYLPLLTLLLPARIGEIAGETRLDLFTITVIAGATAASLSNIAFGWLSDRSLARGRGRRTWVGLGIAMTAASYAAIALAASPVAIILAIVAFQTAINALLAPFLAIMADEIPDSQKGVAGGLLTFAAPVASAFSVLLVSVPALNDTARLMLIPTAVALCVTPMLRTRPRQLVVQPVTHVASPRRYLAIAWGSRLLIQISGAVLSLYLFYYFESLGTQPGLASRVAQVLTIAYALSLPIAVFSGRLSDRIGRRKPFLLAAAFAAALGLTGMAWTRDFGLAALCFGLFQIGSAVFLGLHSAFATQLLPNPAHRGRDLGLLNLTNTLPGLLGPILAWTLATPQDFDAVMLALAALAICGGPVAQQDRASDS